MADVPRLTPAMLSAIGHYLNDPKRHKVSAYRHAYDCSTSSKASVAVQATELFKHPLVAEAVKHVKTEIMTKLVVDSTWVLERLSRLANFNIAKFICQQGTKAVYDFSQATEEDWYCISEYTVDIAQKGTGDDVYEVERVKLKPHCKIQALKLMGEHVQIAAFKDVKKDADQTAAALVDIMGKLADKLPV